jgi:4-amino-4-deoxy-L-arabinose transferase-like glycosyltransferase
VLIFVVLFLRLGSPSFWDPDEAHYAETTRELLTTRDWLAPHYNQQPFFDKPVLFHLLQALPMRLLGPSEFAARVMPALGALALVGTTWWLGVAMGSSEVGLVAGLLLTVSPAVFALSRYAILDTVFTAFLFGGAALTTVAALQDRPRLQFGGYLLVALAILTKGPIALVLCGTAFVLAIVLSADARARFLRLHWIVGALVAIGVSAPWFLYMLWRFNGAFVDGYWLNENVRLFARPLYGRQPEWYFYFRILAAGLLPWTGLLLGRLYDDIRGIVAGDGTVDTFEILLWSWTIAVVGFFSFSRFKLDHYIFPAAPALCLLCSRAWADVRARKLDGVNIGARIGFWLVGPALIIVGVFGGVELGTRLHLPTAAMTVPIGLVAAGVALIGRSVRDVTPPRLPWIVVGALGFTYLGLLIWVAPALEQGKVMPDIAHWVATHADTSDRIATYRLNRWNPAFRFYVDRNTLVLESVEEARRLFDETPSSYCVMVGASYEQLVALGIPLRIVYSREGMWATSGRALWRRRDPLARFLVVERASEMPRVPALPRQHGTE